MTTRYEIKTVRNGTFGVWDRRIQVWQAIRETHEEAETWISQRLSDDAANLRSLARAVTKAC
jgi:hypothetical protein